MIAINGMKMPKNCSDCDLCRGHICKVTGTDIVANPKDNCPLVQIVTCKDCKYYRNQDDDEWCTNHTIKDNKFWVKEDYFCADGERRE